jgi:hypothetical protein
MYKWLAAIVVIYLIGDPNMAYMPSVITIGEMKDLFLAGVIALFVTPWVTAQFDD